MILAIMSLIYFSYNLDLYIYYVSNNKLLKQHIIIIKF